MVTNQVMETTDRELMGVIVRQRTKDEFFNLNDVLYIVDKDLMESRRQRLNFDKFLQGQNVKDFLAELEKEIGTKPYIKGAKNRSGWIHPYFMIKILTHFNPKFEVKVYKWLWDYLIEKRIDSGDSYTTMCGKLYAYSHNKAFFQKNIKGVANKIKEIIGCDDWNQATKEQLKERDLIQTYIADMATTFKDSKLGLKYGIVLFLEKHRGVN